MIDIKFESDKDRAVAFDDSKEIGECHFSCSEKIWVIDHTFVEDSYSGQGIAKKLVDKVVKTARENGIKLSATCSYALRVFKQNNEYSDVYTD